MNTLQTNKKQSFDYKIADWWHKKEDGIHCTLCPHNCVLQNGEIGVCRTRKNINEQLVSLVYGYPCATHVDPVEKKPLNHFLPGSRTFSLSTTGCNLRCLNCQNYQISQADFRQGTYAYVAPESLVSLAIENRCSSIAYTYTDPIVYYEYTLDTAIEAKKAGLKNIIVSAGYIHPKPLRKWLPFIDAANIDLKSMDESTYWKLNGVHLKPVLKTLEILRKSKVWLEITHLIIPEYNDSVSQLSTLFKYLVREGFQDVPLHLSRFFPTYKLSDKQATSIDAMNLAYDMAKDAGMLHVYLGNVNSIQKTQTYCPSCDQLLVSRQGYNVEFVGLSHGHCSKCNTSINGVWE